MQIRIFALKLAHFNATCLIQPTFSRCIDSLGSCYICYIWLHLSRFSVCFRSYSRCWISARTANVSFGYRRSQPGLRGIARRLVATCCISMQQRERVCPTGCDLRSSWSQHQQQQKKQHAQIVSRQSSGPSAVTKTTTTTTTTSVVVLPTSFQIRRRRRRATQVGRRLSSRS